MKKILSLLLICIMLSCSLAGCGSSDGNDSVEIINIGGRPFMFLDTEYWYNNIVVDITERTQYLYLGRDTHAGGLTLLVDSEGKPILYEGEILYYGGEVGN